MITPSENVPIFHKEEQIDIPARNISNVRTENSFDSDEDIQQKLDILPKEKVTTTENVKSSIVDDLDCWDSDSSSFSDGDGQMLPENATSTPLPVSKEPESAKVTNFPPEMETDETDADQKIESRQMQYGNATSTPLHASKESESAANSDLRLTPKKSTPEMEEVKNRQIDYQNATSTPLPAEKEPENSNLKLTRFEESDPNPTSKSSTEIDADLSTVVPRTKSRQIEFETASSSPLRNLNRVTESSDDSTEYDQKLSESANSNYVQTRKEDVTSTMISRAKYFVRSETLEQPRSLDSKESAVSKRRGSRKSRSLRSTHLAMMSRPLVTSSVMDTKGISPDMSSESGI